MKRAWICSLVLAVLAIGSYAHPAQAETGLAGTIAFERYRTPANSETYGMYSYLVSMGVDGSNEKIITPADTAEERVPSYSPDGSRLAYTAGPSWDLYVMDRDGGTPRNITSGGRYGDWWPSWSPDGRRLAFYRTDYNTGETRLHSIRVDGSGLTPLTDGSWADATAAWSPDGKWIAFSRYDPSGDLYAGYQIWAVRPDGSGLRRLTAGRLQTWRPAWSPDGKWLAFGGWFKEDYEGDFYSSKGAIYVMPATGGKPRPVTSGEYYDLEPCWSPDSKMIGFTRTITDLWLYPSLPAPASYYANYSAPADIYAVNLDGSGLTQLTDTPVSEEGCTWTD